MGEPFSNFPNAFTDSTSIDYLNLISRQLLNLGVTNTPTCSSRIDPHRVESDRSDFFRGRGPAGRNPTASIARWREGPLPHGRRRPRNKYGEARRRRHGVSGMPVTNTPTCSSRIDPHRVESDSSDFFRGRGPAGRNPTASIARWREGKLPHSVDLNAQRYWMAPNISQDRPPPAFAGCWPIRTGST